MANKNKGFKEEFARFFEDPSREALRALLQGQVGELDAIDFKREWPALAKVARHILGLANSQGGCLIIGIDEKKDKSFEPVGLDTFLDKAEINKGVKKYISPQLKFEVLDFVYEDSEYPKLIGKKFQVVLVDDEPEYIPFISRADGDGVRENAIYIRRGTSTDEVNYEELQQIINRRIETGYSSRGEFDLNRQLAELNALYEHVEPYYNPYDEIMEEEHRPNYYEPNPNFPDEYFESFIGRLLREKKALIEKMILRK